jgi:2'-5' RNA ligase
VSPANLEALQAMLDRQALQERGFIMSVGGLGAYPSIKRPRVIWIGLQAPEALRSLQQGLEAAAEILGFQREQRSFSPHLTIGRVDQHASSDGLRNLRAKLEGTQIDEIGIVSVDAIRLFRSELQPAGSVYTELFAAPLGA